MTELLTLAAGPRPAADPDALTGEAEHDSFGYSAATAGGVNGDGYADVVVGAFGDSGRTGRVYVYHGGPNGVATTPSTTITGEAPETNFGCAVATAGGMNADGSVLPGDRYGSG